MKKIIALLVVVLVLAVGCLKEPEPMEKADLEMDIEEPVAKEMADDTSVQPDQEEVEEFVDEEVDGVEDLGEDLDTQELEDLETLDEIFEDY